MGGVLAMASFKRSFGLLDEDPVTLANHSGMYLSDTGIFELID
jgi:hypothetical protein